jgi:parvulin-like peptidyl-prolyl isomerase
LTAKSAVKVVATIAGEVIITDDEVNMMMRERAMEFIQLQGEGRQRKESEVYREELKKLIDRELIIHDFVVKIRKNKPAALDEVFDQAKQSGERQIRDFRKSAGLLDDQKYAAFMEARGTDARLFKRFFERSSLMGMFMNSLLKDNGRIVALSQIQEYHKNHPNEFKVEDRVVWKHVFVSTSRFNTANDAQLYAQWVVDSCRSGVDVSELAKKHGHGDSALRNGDGIGNKRGDIRPQELEEPLLALKVGATSNIIPTTNGYHIIKVLERDYGGVKPLDDKIQQAIRNKLTDQLMKQERDKLVTELWRKHTVIIADSLVAPAAVAKPPDTIIIPK